MNAPLGHLGGGGEAMPAAGTTVAGGGQVVRAAGGLVWRQLPSGTEVVLVHRPVYDDWAFPKGKLKPAEKDEDGALREVKEETGLDCRLGPELASTTYETEGRVKSVTYWAMTVDAKSSQAAGDLAPTAEGADEVDEVTWFPLDAARQQLSYPRDVVVLDSLERLVPLAVTEAREPQ